MGRSSAYFHYNEQPHAALLQDTNWYSFKVRTSKIPSTKLTGPFPRRPTARCWGKRGGPPSLLSPSPRQSVLSFQQVVCYASELPCVGDCSPDPLLGKAAKTASCPLPSARSQQIASAQTSFKENHSETGGGVVRGTCPSCASWECGATPKRVLGPMPSSSSSSSASSSTHPRPTR